MCRADAVAAKARDSGLMYGAAEESGGHREAAAEGPQG